MSFVGGEKGMLQSLSYCKHTPSPTTERGEKNGKPGTRVVVRRWSKRRGRASSNTLSDGGRFGGGGKTRFAE